MRPFSSVLKTLPFLSVNCLIFGGCSLTLGEYPLLPAFFLIPVYYWLVFRPDWLPLWSLCGIGLFYDSLMGYEIGFSSLLLMGSAFVGQYILPVLSSYQFPLIWGIFGIYSLVYVILYGFLTSGGLTLLISWGHGVILYPLIAWILSHLHGRLQLYV